MFCLGVVLATGVRGGDIGMVDGLGAPEPLGVEATIRSAELSVQMPSILRGEGPIPLLGRFVPTINVSAKVKDLK